MKVQFLINALLCVSMVGLYADNDDSKAYSKAEFKFSQKEDNGYWDSDMIANLAEAISNLKPKSKIDIQTLYNASLQGTSSQQLIYKYSLLEAARDKLKVFEAQFVNQSDEDFEKLERNDQLKAQYIIDQLSNHDQQGYNIEDSLSKGLEDWLILQGRIAATKSSLDLVDDAEASLSSLDNKQRKDVEQAKEQFENYPVTTLLMVGSIFSLPEKYQEKMGKFLNDGANKSYLKRFLEDNDD